MNSNMNIVRGTRYKKNRRVSGDSQSLSYHRRSLVGDTNKSYLCLFVGHLPSNGQVMSPHHSDQISHCSQFFTYHMRDGWTAILTRAVFVFWLVRQCQRY